MQLFGLTAFKQQLDCGAKLHVQCESAQDHLLALYRSLKNVCSHTHSGVQEQFRFTPLFVLFSIESIAFIAMTSKRPRTHLAGIFPWGSDTEEENGMSQQHALPAATVTRSISCDDAALTFLSYDLAPNHSQAGKVLAHCKNCIQKLRYATGDGALKIVIYKVGITHDCDARFEVYKSQNWSNMLVMASSEDLGFIEMLEAALISHHSHRVQCRNVLMGGEGMRDRDFNPKFQPPFFCYCVTARADRPKWVL